MPSARVKRAVPKGLRAISDVAEQKGKKKLIIPLTTAAKLRIFKKASFSGPTKQKDKDEKLVKKEVKQKGRISKKLSVSPKEEFQTSFTDEEKRAKSKSEEPKKSLTKPQKKQSTASLMSKEDEDKLFLDKTNYKKILYIKPKRFRSPQTSTGSSEDQQKESKDLTKIREHFRRTL